MAKHKGDKWFITERVRALALVYLTRRQDLAVTDAKDGIGIDYLVSIVKEERPGIRQFGVVLRGSVAPLTGVRTNRTLQPSLQSLARLGDLPFPVCLFHFTMENNEGHYAWVAEPLVTEDGEAKLKYQEISRLDKLDSTAMDEIVKRVDRWYDALFANLAI